MNKKLKLISLIVCFALFSQIGFCTQRYQIHCSPSYTDIVVGSRTGDSTGQITISSSDIQQLIITTIPVLTGMNLQTSQATLMVTPVTAGGGTVSVAIQLLCNDSTLTYKPHGRTMVHVCKNNGSCSECEFVKLEDIILTCKCSTTGTSTQPSPCTNTATFLR